MSVTRAVLAGLLAFLISGCGLADSTPVVESSPATESDWVYLMECVEDQLVQKPASFTLTCADAGEVLDALEWSDWGGEQAHATGQVVVNDCTPTCVDGTNHRYDVRVEARRLVRGEALATYSRLRVTPTGAGPSYWKKSENYRLTSVEPVG